MHLAQGLGLAASSYESVGTDAVDEVEKLCQRVVKDFPNSVFFAGKLIFEEPRWYHRVLHNETAAAIQRRIQFAGQQMVILPVRVLETRPA